MLLAAAALLSGLLVLVWSADRFVDGAVGTAQHLKVPALLIGMVIIGFGTSAPEMVVSAMAALDGNPSLAIGNAYGSNISNIALVLGLIAVIAPISVNSSVLRKELPLLAIITLIAGYQLLNGQISRLDAWILLGLFALLMGWSIYAGVTGKDDPLGSPGTDPRPAVPASLGKSLGWLALGLVLLVASSRMLVWGAVTLAQMLGVSDLIIGLTIVAIGTSLPELASGITAVRKGQHDLAIGNILGSNLFNTLAVVGIAGAIHPMTLEHGVLQRDWSLMMALTLVLFAICYGFFGRKPRINRLEGVGLLLVYLAYSGYLTWTIISAAQGA